MSKQRKKYIVDKKFQLKTTFSVIGVVSLITAIIVAAIAINISYNNTKINDINQIQDNIVQFLTTSSLGDTQTKNNDKVYQSAIRKLAIDHSKNIQTLNRIIKYNKYMLALLIFFILAETIILYIILIRKTHRVSGPIYVMSMYLRDIIDGKHPKPRELRDKDELKEFYDLFKEMLEKIKERDNK